MQNTCIYTVQSHYHGYLVWCLFVFSSQENDVCTEKPCLIQISSHTMHSLIFTFFSTCVDVMLPSNSKNCLGNLDLFVNHMITNQKWLFLIIFNMKKGWLVDFAWNFLLDNMIGWLQCLTPQVLVFVFSHVPFVSFQISLKPLQNIHPESLPCFHINAFWCCLHWDHAVDPCKPAIKYFKNQSISAMSLCNNLILELVLHYT